MITQCNYLITDYDITKDYDGLGRVTGVIYPDYAIVSYLYDSGGNLSEIPGYAEYDEYNALGQVGKVYYGNGIETSYWYYPQNNRLFAMKTDQLQTSLLYRNYAYDNKGKVTQINDFANLSVPLNLGTTSVGYTLDPNRAHAVQTASIGTGRTYLYDANGNMTSDSQRTFTYTPENMPKTIALNGVTTTFTYDGNGKRVNKSTPTSSTVYIDGLYECTNGYCDKHIYDANGRLAIETYSQTFFHHADHLGSTSVITDESGNRVKSVAYYPFGETRQEDGIYLNYKYTGQELDSETQLYNYDARLYNPVIGRFITADGIVSDPSNPQNLNRYSYVLNNPMNLVDPTGNEQTASYYINAGGDSGGSAGGGGTGSLQEDWKPVAQLFEGIGREIGRFFGGLFGHKHSAPPQPETFDYYSSNSATSNIGQNIVTSEPFIRFGELIYASQLNALLTGYDFRGNEFSGIERLGQGLIALTNAPMLPGKMGADTARRSVVEQINPRNLLPTQTRSEMSGSQVERLSKDMKINGYDQTRPVTAVRNETGRLEIQDGHHRTEAAIRAGINKIPVRIME